MTEPTRNAYIGHGTYKTVTWADQYEYFSNQKKPLINKEEYNSRLGDDDILSHSTTKWIDSISVDFNIILYCYYFLLLVMSLIVIGTLFLVVPNINSNDSSYVPLFDCVLNQTNLLNSNKTNNKNYEDHKNEILLGYIVFPSLLILGILIMSFIKGYLEERIGNKTSHVCVSIINIFLWIIIIIFEIFSIHNAITFYCYKSFFNSLVGLSIAVVLPILIILIVLIFLCLRYTFRYLFNLVNCMGYNEYTTIP